MPPRHPRHHTVLFAPRHDGARHAGARAHGARLLGRGREADGAAVVDFVLVGGLLTVLFVAVMQLALVLHVRNTLVDAAASGARYGTFADRDANDAVSRTTALITGSLSGGFAQEVTATETAHQGLLTLEVTVRAPLPVIGFVGPAGALEVKGHAAVSR